MKLVRWPVMGGLLLDWYDHGTERGTCPLIRCSLPNVAKQPTQQGHKWADPSPCCCIIKPSSE